jgi:hypothetical protein
MKNQLILDTPPELSLAATKAQAVADVDYDCRPSRMHLTARQNRKSK